MAVAQALAKATESAAAATERAADILHSAGEHIDPCTSRSKPGTGTAGQRGRRGSRGGRGGQVSHVLRSEDGQATPKAAKTAIAPTEDAPSPHAAKDHHHRHDDAASAREADPMPDSKC